MIGTIRPRELSALVGIALLATTLAVVAALYIPVVGIMGRWAADYRIAKLLPPEEQHDGIVLALVNEQTLERFPYREPVDRRFLSDMVRTLERRGARAIGIDMLFDQPTEPDKDAELMSVLREAKIPIVASYAAADSGLTERQLAYLDEFLPREQRGFANLVKGFDKGSVQDDTVRSMYGGRALADGTWIHGFPKALATRLGHSVNREIEPIVWHGRSEEKPPFPAFPIGASAIVPESWISGKVVLIGADLTLRDQHRTPFTTGDGDLLMPGVMIHAHALAQILDGKSQPTVGLTTETALVLVTAFLGILLAVIPGPLWIRLLLASAVLSGIWAGGFHAFRNAGIMLPLVTPTLALLIALWMAEFHMGRQERQQKRFITDAFSKYIAPELVQELVSDPTKLSLSGERREITFLFTDIASFTSLSEASDPGLIGEVLNSHFDGVCPIVLEHGGTIVEFLGDSVFAIFGAPVSQDNHAARAVRCARDIARFAEGFRREQNARGIEIGDTRIGVHTGVALVGNFGSEQRFKYVPVGDAVNTASRIEGLNKHFGTRVCASDDTVQRAGDEMLRPLGEIVLKGKAQPMEIHEVLTPESHESAWMARYREAYALMKGGEIEPARQLFEQLHAEAPEDAATALHLSRLSEGAGDAVVVMQSK